MSLTATTLSGAINATQTSFALAAVTGLTNPSGPTGVAYYLFVENEIMPVTQVNTTTKVVNVSRGWWGTKAVAHPITSEVLYGTAADFPTFQPTIDAFAAPGNKYVGISAPVASATSITCTGPIFHVTGTTTITNMVPPPGMVEGQVTIIFDGIVAGTASGTAAGYAFAVNWTTTAALFTITFTLDAGTALWYPSRIS